MLRALCPAVLLLAGASLGSAGPADTRTVTVLGLSDYHSHAVPFLSEGRDGQGGIARAIAFVSAEKKKGPTLVLSGGDTMNEGTPAWSDEYRCVEWAWWNGILDAMAVGNHEFDYGAEEFERCRKTVAYPLLSANLRGAEGGPLLTHEGRPYLVKEVGGVRLGVMALGGPDMANLVKPERLPAGSAWTDTLEAARAVVRALREDEKVDAVISMGHLHRADDLELARQVPGIDLILGTHSHYKGEFEKLPGTETWFISPYQYLTYVSRVRLRFQDGKLTGASGELVPMDERQAEDRAVAARVREMQEQLREKRPDRFRVLGRTAYALSDQGISSGESGIANWATDVVRRAAGAHAFFSTSSSFRGGLPGGAVTVEDFRTAIPYRNIVVTAKLEGRQLQELLRLAVERRGTDGFAAASGVRYTIERGQPKQVEVLRDPAREAAGYAPLVPEATYLVATTDFQAFVAGGYKEFFAGVPGVSKTDLDVHALLEAELAHGPVSSRLDGRVRVKP